MTPGLIVLASLLILAAPSRGLAAPTDDVRAATQAWIDGMNSHDAERVVALYDEEAVLWGTRSPSPVVQGLPGRAAHPRLWRHRDQHGELHLHGGTRWKDDLASGPLQLRLPDS